LLKIIKAENDEQYEHAREVTRGLLTWQRRTYADQLPLLEKYYDPVTFDAWVLAYPGPFAPPDGCLLLAYLDGMPAGAVGLRKFADGICEMKSMFVFPQFHGRGIGKALAKTLILESRRIGYQKMRLDTGPRQIAAATLYRRLGFRDIEAYYDLPLELAGEGTFMELDL